MQHSNSYSNVKNIDLLTALQVRILGLFTSKIGSPLQVALFFLS